MAITFGQVNLPTRSFSVGDRLEVLMDFTCDNSYPTGGYSIVGSTFGLTTEIDFINAAQGMAGGVVYSFFYNYATGKLQVTTGAAEVANATNLAALSSRMVAKGKGFAISNV